MALTFEGELCDNGLPGDGTVRVDNINKGNIGGLSNGKVV